MKIKRYKGEKLSTTVCWQNCIQFYKMCGKYKPSSENRHFLSVEKWSGFEEKIHLLKYEKTEKNIYFKKINVFSNCYAQEYGVYLLLRD